MEKLLRLHVVTLALVVFLSVNVMSGCQKDDNDDDGGGKEIVRPTVTEKTPIRYDLHDPSCIRDNDEVKLNKTGIWGWRGFNITEEQIPLDRTITKESITSPLVSGTSYDRRYLRVCPGASELNCTDSEGDRIGWTLEDPESNLRACEDEFTYPRDTYEGAGLTSLHYLNEAGRAYQDAMGKPLPEIHLDVFPVFESQFFGRTDPNTGEKVNVKEYIADNLAYYPGHNLVVVFPQSQDFADAGLDKFWESSFVLAHELGHHIEEVHVGARIDEMGLRWDPMLHEYRSLLGAGDYNEQRNLSYFWTSISEAFADLNAYYGNNEDVSSLELVDCLGANRNITNEMFADETTEKKLDSYAVMDLMSGGSGIGFCDGVDLSQPHTIGAVVAHNIRRVIATLVPSDSEIPSDNVINARYKLSIAWIKAMVEAQIDQKDRDYSSVSELYQPVADAIESIAKGASDRQKSDICGIAAERLQVLDPKPFSSYCQWF